MKLKENRQIRLNKFIADCGVSSRRKADALISEGSVQINGKRVFELGRKIDPAKDLVTLNGKKLHTQSHKIYIMLNKPTGVLSTMNDPKGRPTVADLVKKIPYRLFPVGRLDWDSEGLLLLTNDGNFYDRIAHPRNEISKTYLVKLNGKPSAEHLQRLKTGVTIPGGRAKAVIVEKIPGRSSQYEWLKISITQGRYRQIRMMMQKIGFDVLKLQRIAIGKLHLGKLKRGDFVYLPQNVIEKIFQNEPIRTSHRKLKLNSKKINRKEKNHRVF